MFYPTVIALQNPQTLKQMSLFLVSSPVMILPNAPEENKTSFSCYPFTFLLPMSLFNFLSHFLQFQTFHFQVQTP